VPAIYATIFLSCVMERCFHQILCISAAFPDVGQVHVQQPCVLAHSKEGIIQKTSSSSNNPACLQRRQAASQLQKRLPGPGHGLLPAAPSEVRHSESALGPGVTPGVSLMRKSHSGPGSHGTRRPSDPARGQGPSGSESESVQTPVTEHRTKVHKFVTGGRRQRSPTAQAPTLGFPSRPARRPGAASRDAAGYKRKRAA
jgi:hypothetical protein